MNCIWLIIILLLCGNNFGGRDCDDCDRNRSDRDCDCDRRRDDRNRDCDRNRDNDCDDCGRRFENERRERFEGERRERCEDDFRGRSSIPSPRSMPCTNFPGMCGCEEKGNSQEK